MPRPSVLVASFVVFASVASAQTEPGCLERVGTWGGYGSTEAVSLSGDLVVFGGNALMVADVTDPRRPRVVGEARLPVHSSAARDLCGPSNFASEPTRLADLAWLGDGTTVVGAARCEGMAVFDLTDPGRPELIRMVPLPGDTRLVAAFGELVLAVTYDRTENDFTLQVHDLSRPLASELGSFGGEGWPVGLAVEGDLAALAVAGSSDPGRLSRVELFGLSTSGGLSRRPPLLGSYLAVAAAAHLLYLGHQHGGLDIVDVSQPSFPRRRGSVGGLGGRVTGLSVEDGLVVAVLDDRQVVLVDAEDPGAPRVAGTLAEPSAIPLGFRSVVADGFAYLAAGRDGLRVVDASDPEIPVDVGFAVEATGVGELEILGSGFVVGAVPYRGFTIFDLSGNDAPRARGTVGIEKPDRLGPGIGTVSGSRGYAVTSNDIWVLDFENPDHPHVLEHVTTWEGQVQLGHEALGGRAPLLFLIGDHGLSVLDVADPSRPRQIATSFDTRAYWHLNMWCPEQIGDALLLAQSTAYDEAPWVSGPNPPEGLRVLDVSNPVEPRETSWSEIGHEVERLVTDGRVAATGVASTRVTLFDVEDPYHPRPGSELELDGVAIALAMDRGLLAVCDWKDDPPGIDLLVVDVIDPAAPLVLDRVPVTHCVDLILASGRLALSGVNAGLEVWDASECSLRAPSAGPPRQPSGRRPGVGGGTAGGRPEWGRRDPR